MTFFWIRHKGLDGGWIVATLYEDGVWQIPGDEQMWDRKNVEAEYEIGDEIPPPAVNAGD